METGPNQNGQVEPPIGGARFRWPVFVLWIAGSLVQGAVVAWLAVVAGSYFSPLVLFSLMVGVVLGAIAVAAMRVAQVGNRPTVLLGTALAALVTVAGQHYFSYERAWSHYREAARNAESKSQILQKAPAEFARRVMDRMPAAPGTFGHYMAKQAEEGRPVGAWRARGWLAWASWGLDGLLVAAAALALVAASVRLPYCDRCRSWYRTTRAGELDVGTASEVAGLVGIGLPRRIRSAGFRLQACTGGCGPTALELHWERTRGGRSSQHVWLNAEQRERVSRVLDARIGGGVASA
jgi:hypothetical protein